MKFMTTPTSPVVLFFLRAVRLFAELAFDFVFTAAAAAVGTAMYWSYGVTQ